MDVAKYQSNRVYGDEIPLAVEYIDRVKREHGAKVFMCEVCKFLEKEYNNFFLKKFKDEQAMDGLLWSRT